MAKKAKKVIKVLVIYDCNCDGGSMWDTYEEVRIHELDEDVLWEDETPKSWIKDHSEYIKKLYKKEKQGAFAVIGAYINPTKRNPQAINTELYRSNPCIFVGISK